VEEWREPRLHKRWRTLSFPELLVLDLGQASIYRGEGQFARVGTGNGWSSLYLRVTELATVAAQGYSLYTSNYRGPLQLSSMLLCTSCVQGMGFDPARHTPYHGRTYSVEGKEKLNKSLQVGGKLLKYRVC
jgi:hypothetical protein